MQDVVPQSNAQHLGDYNGRVGVQDPNESLWYRVWESERNLAGEEFLNLSNSKSYFQWLKLHAFCIAAVAILSRNCRRQNRCT